MATVLPISALRSPGRALISPVADALLIAGAPLVALAVTATASRTIGSESMAALVGVLIVAHLLVTLVHSHGNAEVFARHRLRFTIVPLALLALLSTLPRLFVALVPVAVLWDMHHSSMQTFGLLRLYARRAGNGDGRGRLLDLLVAHATYSAPVLAGAGLTIHAERAGRWGRFLLARLDDPRLAPWRMAVAVAGAAIVVLHGVGTWRLARSGMPVSPWALLTVGATACVSVASWGFDSFGAALATMKLFHCVQYFAIVTYSEHRQACAWVGRRVSLGAAGSILLGGALLVAVAGHVSAAFETTWGAALLLTLTLMHFWWDGFTWSARRRGQS